MFFSKKKNSDKEKNIQNDDRIKVDTSTITTMVGVDTVVEGLLKTKSSIRINGTVIGDVRADGVVVLTKTGKIVGTIEAESIIVAGVVEGNMSIRDKVNVEATGEIYGEVITKKFVIDEESIFQGNCVMNRDGKIIPVPPYVKDADKKEEKEANKDTSEKEGKKEKESEEKSSDEKDECKSDKEEKKDEEKKDISKDKDIEDKTEDSTEEKDEDKEDKDSEKEGDKPVEESEVNDTDEEKKDSDDTIIIADINEVEAADDIPASDGVHYKKDKKHNKNYVKKSKSLSVEIQS